MAFPVTLRFYEELNFFLHHGKRKMPFVHIVPHSTTVKDVIESLGVPHTEIDLILANSRPVAFNYKLQPNDFISVYPVFETLDISGIKHLQHKPIRNPKFIPDVHLGKLTRYLRLLGFDCYYDTIISDPDIIDLSLRENRIILTRDLGILKNSRVTHGYFLKSQNSKEQLNEVIKRFQLEKMMKPFSRCTQCNGMIKHVTKEDVMQHLEPRTKKYYSRFYRCNSCGSVYWEGSHYIRMNRFISDIMNENNPAKSGIEWPVDANSFDKS